MNLLSKLSSSAKAKTIEPREIFMTLPSKAPGYGYPRDVQSEVWKKWFDIRNEKNVILKMNTGSGKTVVGLIMLQSCLNEEKGPAIYVVPDNYLVKQVIDEAKRLGISATEDKDDYSYSNSKAILVTSIQTIVNGYSYFGMREGGNYPIGSRGICSFLIGCTVKSRSASGRIKGSCPQGKGTFCMRLQAGPKTGGSPGQE